MIPGKKTLKFIKSLQLKKYRKQSGLFIVEGAKNVLEILSSDYELFMICATSPFLEKNKDKVYEKKIEIYEVKEDILASIGRLNSNNSVLAVARMKPNIPFEVDRGEIALAIDDISEPGNLGAIIRTADWYGIRKIICSTETADFYNPKVIAATMGSFVRVAIYYVDLASFLQDSLLPVYGAFLQGSDIHTLKIKEGLVILGNESRGIRKELLPFISQEITIPRYGQAESLNVAAAAAVICDCIRR